MAEFRDRSSSSGSALMVSAVAGAVLGAAGLAWWLLREAERRRRPAGLPPQVMGEGVENPNLGYRRAEVAPGPQRPPAGPLHDRVHQLNLAIEDVRRQLEHLQTSADN